MDLLDLFGINILSFDIPDFGTKENLPVRKRTNSFIEEKRGYKKEGKDRDLPPYCDTCPILKDIYKNLEKFIPRYITLINLYSMLLCQLSSCKVDNENIDKIKEEIKTRMINQRIEDLQNLNAVLEDTDIIQATSKDMSIFLSLVNNLFKQEIDRLKNDRDIYYYVKEKFEKDHERFYSAYLEELKQY